MLFTSRGERLCVRVRARGVRSMAPAASPGKPRCLVSEGVECLKVFDIISGPDRWQRSGVPPAAGGKKKLGLFSPLKTYIPVCVCSCTSVY